VPPPSYCRTLDRPGASPEVKGHQHEACRQRVSNAGLSSSASKAVRDYFSRQGGVEGCANQRSQEVALVFSKVVQSVCAGSKAKERRRRPSGSKSMAKLINNVFGKRRKSV
jgi:Ras-related and estrogen-regulated growth inhibitor-like protein